MLNRGFETRLIDMVPKVSSVLIVMFICFGTSLVNMVTKVRELFQKLINIILKYLVFIDYNNKCFKTSLFNIPKNN